MTEKDRPLQILLVEDNPVDVLMTRETLKTWEIQNNLRVVEDGHEAVLFFTGEGFTTRRNDPI